MESMIERSENETKKSRRTLITYKCESSLDRNIDINRTNTMFMLSINIPLYEVISSEI